MALLAPLGFHETNSMPECRGETECLLTGDVGPLNLPSGVMLPVAPWPPGLDA